MAQFTITTAALNFTGDRETFTFTCANDGGYVRFDGGAWDGRQVCVRLSLTGVGLFASAASLPNLIRQELIRRRRSNAKVNA